MAQDWSKKSSGHNTYVQPGEYFNDTSLISDEAVAAYERATGKNTKLPPMGIFKTTPTKPSNRLSPAPSTTGFGRQPQPLHQQYPTQAPARTSTPPGFKPKNSRSIAAAANYGVSQRQWGLLSRAEKRQISSHPNQNKSLALLERIKNS